MEWEGWAYWGMEAGRETSTNPQQCLLRPCQLSPHLGSSPLGPATFPGQQEGDHWTDPLMCCSSKIWLCRASGLQGPASWLACPGDPMIFTRMRKAKAGVRACVCV